MMTQLSEHFFLSTQTLFICLLKPQLYTILGGEVFNSVLCSYICLLCSCVASIKEDTKPKVVLVENQVRLSGSLDKFYHVPFFFQDRESKILQLERQLDEQSQRLLALGSPNSDILTTENGTELGRNLIWIFVVPAILGFVYKIKLIFVYRSCKQDDEESQ